MKKIILLILTAFIGLFAFNFNAKAEAKYTKAKCADSTATCYYNLGNATITFNYKNRSITSACAVSSAAASGGVSATCNAVAVAQNWFVKEDTGDLKCPVLYSTVSFNTAYRAYEYTITPNSVRNSSSLSPASTIDNKTCEGTPDGTGGTSPDSGTCICGAVSMTASETTISGYPGYTIHRASDLKYDGGTCPEAVTFSCYDVGGVKTCTVSSSTVLEHGSKCNDAQAVEDHYSGGGTGNDTDYKPLEDKIASFCTETSRAWRVFGYLVMALKILVPVIIIVMGSLDLGKAVVANSEDEMKKATQVLIKRIIAGIVIFFIPTVINLVLKLASNYVSVIDSGSGCIKCVSKPGSC